VKIIRLGIGDTKKENQIFIVRRTDSATGSMDEGLQSRIVAEENFKQIQSSVDTLDGAIDTYELPKPDFLKIDIEGMEYQALMGMSKTINTCSPQIYVEIHGVDDVSKRENIRRISELFQSLGYSIFHIETQQNITISNCSIARVGHIFCSRPYIPKSERQTDQQTI
jgi:hypothetical protein